MELLGTELEGKREDLQWIQDLVPLCHLSLNWNVCGLRRCFRVGNSDEDLPFLAQRILFGTWNINGSNN